MHSDERYTHCFLVVLHRLRERTALMCFMATSEARCACLLASDVAMALERCHSYVHPRRLHYTSAGSTSRYTHSGQHLLQCFSITLEMRLLQVSACRKALLANSQSAPVQYAFSVYICQQNCQSCYDLGCRVGCMSGEHEPRVATTSRQPVHWSCPLRGTC